MLCILFIALPVRAANGNEESITGRNDTVEEKNMFTFFSDYLTGKSTVFGSKKKLGLNGVSEARQAVWNAWREANKNLEEEKLFEPDDLNKAKHGKWNLPEELEPKAVMPYLFGTKGETRPQNGYPFFLYIHGSGPKAMEWKAGWEICRRFDDAPSLYFIPQIPNEGRYYRWWQKSKQYAWEKLLRQLFVGGWVNPKRMYLFGISEGGYGGQRLASFYADYWAAAGPMAGGEPLKNAPAENCANIAFSLRTGDKDFGFYRNILSTYVKNEFDSLQSVYPDEFRHWIELVPDKGHAIDYAPTPEWLKQFERNVYPKHVLWEDFEMDGLHRKGFYNLYVNQRPEGAERALYEMTIEGNDITLTVKTVDYQTIQKDHQWDIDMKFKKSHQEATGGRLTVYLCEELVDLSKPVTLTVNGKLIYKGKVKPEWKHLVNSCAAYFDPMRLYPAAIEVSY